MKISDAEINKYLCIIIFSDAEICKNICVLLFSDMSFIIYLEFYIIYYLKAIILCKSLVILFILLNLQTVS